MVATIYSTDFLQTNEIVDNTTGLITAAFIRNLTESAAGWAFSTQTASYQPVIGDRGTLVLMNVASANNFTVPSSVFPVGGLLHVMWFGAGATTIVAAGGVTINTPSTLGLRTQYAIASMLQYATNTWVAFGDLT